MPKEKQSWHPCVGRSEEAAPRTGTRWEPLAGLRPRARCSQRGGVGPRKAQHASGARGCSPPPDGPARGRQLRPPPRSPGPGHSPVSPPEAEGDASPTPIPALRTGAFRPGPRASPAPSHLGGPFCPGGGCLLHCHLHTPLGRRERWNHLPNMQKRREESVSQENAAGRGPASCPGPTGLRDYADVSLAGPAVEQRSLPVNRNCEFPKGKGRRG